MIGKETGALLFIEGRNLPFVQAVVTATVGSPTTANIDMIPLSECSEFLPGTSIAIFVKDISYPGNLKPWVLLFSGFLNGYQSHRTVESRAFSLMAVSDSFLWDSAKQYYMNMNVSMKGSATSPADLVEQSKLRKELAANKEPVVQTTTTVLAYVTKILTAEMKKGQDLVHACMAVLRKVTNVNSFYRYNTEKYRLMDRTSLVSSGEILKLLNIVKTEEFFNTYLSGGGSAETSVRDLLTMIMSLVFHEMNEPMAPSTITRATKNGINDGNETIASFLFNPESYMLPPPKCNILFPEHYSSIGYTRVFSNEQTRTLFQPSMSVVQQTAPGATMALMPTYYSPGGYREFQTKDKGNIRASEPVQYTGPEGQGTVNDSVGKAEMTSPKLQDFNYLSFEEILKGINAVKLHAPPSASLFTRTMSKDARKNYFSNLSDYLFYQNRYVSRTAATAGPLNIAPVVGFPMLIIDSSEIEDHVVAKLHSMTHVISGSGGATTQYQFNYVRHLGERDVWSGETIEPPIPPWYDAKIFGYRGEVTPADYENLYNKAHHIPFLRAVELNYFPDIGNYYKQLIGTYVQSRSEGSDSITDKDFPTLMGAAFKMIERYNFNTGSDKVDDFIGAQTRRSYVLLEDYFTFMGAELEDDQKGISFKPNVEDWTVFSGAFFDGGYVDSAPDKNDRDVKLKDYFGEECLMKRRDPVDRYRFKLLTQRGFKG